MGLQPHQVYLSRVYEIGLSRATLARLHALTVRHKRVALLGFSDYAKHLINLIPDRIACVVDEAPQRTGIQFRGKPVMRLDDAPAVDAYVLTRYEGLMDFQRLLADKRLIPAKPYIYAEDYEGRSTATIDVFSQVGLYRSIAAAGKSPPTMMNNDRIILLVEMLRTALAKPGIVVEIGAWQGGSAWNLCQALSYLKSDRKAMIFDMFEQADSQTGRAIMSNDEIRRALAFYPPAEIVVGDVRKTVTALQNQKICFLHLDNLFQEMTLPYIWSRMPSGGIILLDNYGHVPAQPAQFDRFFESKGARVAYIPPLGQGLVIKP